MPMIVARKSVPHGDLLVVELPAGTYYVGDGCYVLDDESLWQPMVDIAFPPGCGSGLTQLIEIDGKFLVKWGTQHGDGTYTGRIGNKIVDLGVDSGSLAFVAVELCKTQDEAELRKVGGVIKFDEPVTVTIHENCDASTSDDRVYIEVDQPEPDFDGEDYGDDDDEEEEDFE